MHVVHHVQSQDMLRVCKFASPTTYNLSSAEHWQYAVGSTGTWKCQYSINYHNVTQIMLVIKPHYTSTRTTPHSRSSQSDCHIGLSWCALLTSEHPARPASEQPADTCQLLAGITNPSSQVQAVVAAFLHVLQHQETYNCSQQQNTDQQI